MRKIWGVLIGLVVLIVVILLGGWLYLRGSLPKTSGTVNLAGLDGQVEIVRDVDGVPHIFAATDHDAFFALGYVHAQDRLWQMEFQRRVGAGRLSEILGEATVDTDKFLRTLGVYRVTKENWEIYEEDTKLMVQAYTDGVNAWLEEGYRLPPEFIILGVEPEPWTIYDTLVWPKMVAWDLGRTYPNDLLQTRLNQAIGIDRASELMPAYPEDGATILSNEQIAAETADALLKLDAKLQSTLQLGGLHVGSNNWVIGGSLTESGTPIVANDPHLRARIPSIWYLMELQGDSIHVTGATLPGVPVMASGHNEHIAWGVTNVGPDVQDLYIERINPKNPNQYQVDGKWVDMVIVEEKIYVKDEEEPILWAARSTRHGPLISDVIDNAQTPLALRWTALEATDTTYDSFRRFNYATNWQEFTEALAFYYAPSQNFVYADIEGNIGYYAPGRIPIRDRGIGNVPVPGWNSRYEWGDWIPHEELPHVFNPEVDFIVTANNKVVPDEYPYFISNNWAPPYRAERIVELIEEKSSNGEKISIEDMIAIQADQYSAQTKALLPYLLTVEAIDERQKEAMAYLKDWDGESNVDSIATTIYEAWLVALGRTLFEDDLPGDLYEDFADRRYDTFIVNVLSASESSWCDNVLSAPPESCMDIAQQALNTALDDLESLAGDTMAEWQWGKVHRTQYPHSPFSEVDSLKRFFHREIANGGDSYTVNVASVTISEPFLQYHVPSYREIISLDDWNSSLFMHTTGQSGNVFSEHYDDLIERHQAVEYVPMSFGRSNVTGDVLVLRPK